MNMKILEYRIGTTTPMFLGNAEQKGQWRTPAIKALIRHWWRVVQASKYPNPSHYDIQNVEDVLFGNARTKESTQQSQVRIRLQHWRAGTLTNDEWVALEPLAHPEVKNKKVASDLYLGYGPISFNREKRQGALKAGAAIQAEEQNTLSVAVPDEKIRDFEIVFALIDAYGTLGGRSRNGWGSITLTPTESTLSGPINFNEIQRQWQDALSLDWPHAIGRDDDGPLIWETRAYSSWKDVMVELARTKIAVRTHFKFSTGNYTEKVESRHWLSHPITNHNVKDWRLGRLPNTLRFKVRPCPQNSSKLRGIIFHVPCKPPKQFRPDRNALESVWRRVHAKLDSTELNLARIPE